MNRLGGLAVVTTALTFAGACGDGAPARVDAGDAAVPGDVAAASDATEAQSDVDAAAADAVSEDATVDAANDAGPDASEGREAGGGGAEVADVDASPDSVDASGVDADADGGFASAPHPSLPQVKNQGGPVLANPVLTAITYDGYDLRVSAEEVVAKIGASDYWKATTAEYGVGPATARAPVRLAEAAPMTIDDFQIQTWLASRLDGTHPEFGTPTQSSVYVIYFPTGTTVTNATLSSCAAFGGYHASVWLPTPAPGGTNVAYAVIPECAGKAGTLFSMETSSSHELVEAVTDPFGTTKSPGVAWSDVGDDHLVWQALLGGGEVTDLCQLLYGATFVPFPYGHAVQRSWSNAAARAGHDPCAPSLPGETYFAAAAVLPDTVTLRLGGVDRATKGVLIPLGGSRAVEVDLWSDGPTTGPWKVSAVDMTPLLGGAAGSLTFAWDATTGSSGSNGTKLELTITVMKAAGPTGGQAFMIQSEDGPRHEWFGYVAQK